MARLDLGAGLVVFPDLVPLLDEIGDRADVYELEPQTCWLPTGDPDRPWRTDREVFASIAGRHRPVLAHGVSAPVGGTEPPDPRAVALFAESVAALGAVAASEHLAFNRAVVDGSTVETGLFLPPCPSDALVELAIESIATYQRHLSVPFSIENAVSYLRPRPGELPDSTIVARVAEGADCGILLDLHNLWCNERNGRESTADALARLPLERVTEVHLAGGQWLGGCYLDAHSGPVDPELMATAARVLPMLPEVRAVLFEILPSRLWGVGVDPLLAQLESLQDLVEQARRAARRRPPAEPHDAEAPDIADRPLDADSAADPSPAAWESDLASAAIGAATTVDDPAVPVLRELVDAGRRGRVSAAARTTIRLLLVSCPDDVDRILDDYCRARSPRLWSHDEGAQLLSWLAAQELPIARLGDAVQLDLAALRHAIDGGAQQVVLDGDPNRLLAALAAGDQPPPPDQPTLATVG